jgi:phospholipase/carboxylesterase
MTTSEAVARWKCATGDNERGALIVLLHDHGSDENALFPLAASLPRQATVAALRAPIASASGYAWFAQWDPQHPIPASLANAVDYVERWLDDAAGDAEEIWFVGDGAGATLAAALLVHAPQRYAGATLCGVASPPLVASPSSLEVFVGSFDGVAAWFTTRFSPPSVPPQENS